MIHINENNCVGCGYCETNCPYLAIAVFGVAKLNMEECEGCMKCLSVCPTNSIRMM
ncbi:MAG: 4Fe-4S binding protein [Candidatus Methanospirareceae archaeon]